MECPHQVNYLLHPKRFSIFGNNKQKTKNVWDAIGDLPDADIPSETAIRISESIKDRIVKYGY